MQDIIRHMVYTYLSRFQEFELKNYVNLEL